MPSNVIPATAPAWSPETVQTESAAGPSRVSEPPCPWTATGRAAATTESSSRIRSLPLLPSTRTAVTPVASIASTVPSAWT